MKKPVKAILVAGLATAGLLGGLAVVNAQSEAGPRPMHMRGDKDDAGRPGPGHGPGPRAGMMGGPLGMIGMLCEPQRDAMLAGAIAYGEKRLEITPAQMAAWTKLTAALNAGSARVGQSCEAAKAAGTPETSSQHLALMETRMKDGLAIVQEVRPAYDALYASLTDVQKKTLEDMLARRMARHGGPGEHRDRHERHDRHDRNRG